MMSEEEEEEEEDPVPDPSTPFGSSYVSFPSNKELAVQDNSSLQLNAMPSDENGKSRETPFPFDVNPHKSLNMANLSMWIACLLVVTFDLELGQAIEEAYPLGSALSDTEKKNICFLSFPDSNAGYHGDMVFCFKTPVAPTSTKSVTETVIMRSKHDVNSDSGSSMTGNTASLPVKKSPSTSKAPTRRRKTRHLYGSVYFRQVKDETLKRGYFQKSIVIVAYKPFIGLFNRLVRFIAPAFFTHGKVVLDTACQQISHWPAPAPGSMELSILGQVIQVNMPDENDCSTNFLCGDPYQRPDVYEVDGVSAMQVCNLAGTFKHMLDDLWLLWELVLTAQPILVISHSPTSCSEAVLGLVSLIAPIKYCCDYRPFFTIHDPAFHDYCKTDRPPPSVILGITNPHFNEALEHWPNIIRLAAPPRNGNSRTASPVAGRNSPKAGLGLSWNNSLLNKKPGVYSNHNLTCEKDKSFLKKVNAIKPTYGAKLPSDLVGLVWCEGATPCPSIEATGLTGVVRQLPPRDMANELVLLRKQHQAIRQYFFQLTQNFMNPLEQYYASLMPLQKKISPWRPIPRLRQFDNVAFLATVPESLRGFPTVRGQSLSRLYERFLATPHFEGWLRNKIRNANRRVRGLYLDQLVQVKMSEWMATHSEIEAVDQLLRMRELLGIKSELLTPTVVAKVQEHIETIVNSFPEDLRNSLRSF